MVLLQLKTIFNVSVFKQVGGFAYVWGLKVKVAHFVLFPAFVGECSVHYSVLYLMFNLWSVVVGYLLFFTMWRMVCHSLCSRSLLRGGGGGYTSSQCSICMPQSYVHLGGWIGS